MKLLDYKGNRLFININSSEITENEFDLNAYHLSVVPLYKIIHESRLDLQGMILIFNW